MKHLLNEATQLLYLEGIDGSYIKEVEVNVVGYESGGYILDKTMMHYEGGGQPGDKGYLLTAEKKVTVFNVKKKGSKVLHLSTDGNMSGRAKLVVNWERRYKIMKMHTLQHAISAFIFKEGSMTMKSEVFPGSGFIEVDRPLRKIPEGAYSIATEKRNVSRRFIDRKDLNPETLKRCNLEKLPKSVDRISIVEIEGMDICACAGTHLRNTGEIGEYWIRNTGRIIEFGLI